MSSANKYWLEKLIFDASFDFRCHCDLKYTGQHCEQLFVPCSPSPCLNGGTCVTSGTTTYQCLCKTGRYHQGHIPMPM